VQFASYTPSLVILQLEEARRKIAEALVGRVEFGRALLDSNPKFCLSIP
jgi:hypothetical protein